MVEATSTGWQGSIVLTSNYYAIMSRYWPGPVTEYHLSWRKSVGHNRGSAGGRWKWGGRQSVTTKAAHQTLLEAGRGGLP